MRVGLCICGRKGLAVLRHFIAKFPDILELVVHNHDSNVDEDFTNIVTELCNLNKIQLKTALPRSLPNVDTILAIGWRKMIRLESNLKVYVIHDSLLPRYRGFAPLVSALENGDSVVGATLLEADSQYDKGPILFQRSFAVEYPIKISAAIDRMSFTYTQLVDDFIANIGSNIFEPTSQSESDATYSLWRDSSDYFVDWNDTSERISRFVDAVGYPYAGARIRTGKDEYIVDECTPFGDVLVENRKCGKIIFIDHGCPVVVCGQGLLKLTKLRKVEGCSQSVVHNWDRFRVHFT